MKHPIEENKDEFYFDGQAQRGNNVDALAKQLRESSQKNFSLTTKKAQLFL